MSNDLKSKIPFSGKKKEGYPAHFKTNLSPVYQKEDTEDTELDAQFKKGEINFGYNKGFNKIEQDKTFLHGIDTILVPANNKTGEVVYDANWSINTSTNHKFGEAKQSTAIDAVATFTFSGVSCFVGLVQIQSVLLQGFTCELSSDGGDTWENKKTILVTSSVATAYNNIKELYSNLEYGDYSVRLTSISSDYIQLEYFGYTTYMNQVPVTNNFITTKANSVIVDAITASFYIQTTTPHNLEVNDQVILRSTTGYDPTNGTFPANLIEGQNYYVIHVPTTTTFSVALSQGGTEISPDSPSTVINCKVFYSSYNVPINTCLCSSLTTGLKLESSSWNSSNISIPSTVGKYIDIRFKGSKIWLNITLTTITSEIISVLIDGVSTSVKLPSITNATLVATTHPVWIRIDDGTLSEGEHLVTITNESITKTIILAGMGYYTSLSDSTTSRSLICGKDSYGVGIDNTGFIFNGVGWVSGENTKSYLRRSAITSTINEYVTFNIPANVKSTYLICSRGTSGGDIKCSVGSTQIKYVTLDTNTFVQNNMITPLYTDGVGAGSPLKIENLGGTLEIEGLFFEIGYPIENNELVCLPKWTRYADSVGTTPKLHIPSNSHRLDVYGLHDNPNEKCREPMVESNLMYIGNGAISTEWINYYRHGLGLCDYKAQYSMSGFKNNNILAYDFIQYKFLEAHFILHNVEGDVGLLFHLIKTNTVGVADALQYLRIKLFINKVI